MSLTLTLSPAVPLLPAVLMATTLETLAVGVYVPLCVRTISVLLRPQKSAVIQRTMLIITVVQSAALLAHWTINMYRLVEGFVHTKNLPIGSLIYFATISHPTYITVTALFLLQGTISLSFMIYRLHVIWDYTYAVCIPALCGLCILVVGGIGCCVQFGQVKYLEIIYSSHAQPWVVSTLVAGAITNIYCTSMVCYRILRRHGGFRGRKDEMRSSSVMYALRVMVDSAAICVLVTICLLVSYCLQSNMDYIFIFLEPPVIGIAYCLIVVRVGGRVNQNSFAKHADTYGRSTLVFRNASPTFSHMEPQLSYAGSTDRALPMNVIITKEIHEELDNTLPRRYRKDSDFLSYEDVEPQKLSNDGMMIGRAI